MAVFLGPLFVAVLGASTCEIGVTPADPRFSLTDCVFLSTNHTRQLLLFNSASDKQWKMSRYIDNNTNSFNVSSYYPVADDRSQLLAWLSPLEPKLRHRNIQEHRIDDVGEWLIQSEEFRRWCKLGGEVEGDMAVLFCYGDLGVGKTFIR